MARRHGASDTALNREQSGKWRNEFQNCNVKGSGHKEKRAKRGHEKALSEYGLDRRVDERGRTPAMLLIGHV
jgi:hypothetical protein